MYGTFQPFDVTRPAAPPAGGGVRVQVTGEGHQVPVQGSEGVEVPGF